MERPLVRTASTVLHVLVSLLLFPTLAYGKLTKSEHLDIATAIEKADKRLASPDTFKENQQAIEYQLALARNRKTAFKNEKLSPLSVFGFYGERFQYEDAISVAELLVSEFGYRIPVPPFSREQFSKITEAALDQNHVGYSGPSRQIFFQNAARQIEQIQADIVVPRTVIEDFTLNEPTGTLEKLPRVLDLIQRTEEGRELVRKVQQKIKAGQLVILPFSVERYKKHTESQFPSEQYPRAYLYQGPQGPAEIVLNLYEELGLVLVDLVHEMDHATDENSEARTAFMKSLGQKREAIFCMRKTTGDFSFGEYRRKALNDQIDLVSEIDAFLTEYSAYSRESRFREQFARLYPQSASYFLAHAEKGSGVYPNITPERIRRAYSVGFSNLTHITLEPAQLKEAFESRKDLIAAAQEQKVAPICDNLRKLALEGTAKKREFKRPTLFFRATVREFQKWMQKAINPTNRFLKKEEK